MYLPEESRQVNKYTTLFCNLKLNDVNNEKSEKQDLKVFHITLILGGRLYRIFECGHTEVEQSFLQGI
jgi:hypothetical protein